MFDPKQDKKDKELDDFWNVEDLLPQKPARRSQPSPRPTPTAIDVEVPLVSAQTEESLQIQSPSAAPVESSPLTLPRNSSVPSPQGEPGEESESPSLEYIPDGALLHRVKIYGWQANYHYFDQFADEAIRYHGMKPPAEAKPQAFFSYFPQYVQLGRRATAWYLYWREGVRRGTYMDTDYAYILLYLFELINLPAEDSVTAREHRDLMAKVWMAYRKSYRQLDHYMCEWLCDYCLIHALPAPVDLLAPALDDIIMGSRLKEFYLSAAVRVPEDGSVDTAMETARILMRHCCQYDYRKSKFALGEHKEMFDSIIPAAVASAIPLLLGEGGRKPAITMLESTLTRDAYTGALCSYRNKRRIEVAYTSFSRSHELRFLIGDMVKHIENRLRGWIGVRSKLSVMSLPIPLRDALDAYLNPLAPPKNAVPVKKKDTPRPAYEALYDLPKKPVSLADASAIEADSWETTRILVEAFEEHPNACENGERIGFSAPSAEIDFPDIPVPEIRVHDPEPQEIPLPVTVPPRPMSSHDPEPAEDTAMDSPFAPYADFIRAALRGDSAAQKQAAAALRKMPDAVADEINALTADGDLGDILLEEDGMGGYTVIEDYREWAETIHAECRK